MLSRLAQVIVFPEILSSLEVSSNIKFTAAAGQKNTS
jgi:hypothetical protein